MPLPLTVTCFSKIQIVFTRVVLDKRPLNGCACVITYLLTFFLSSLKRLWLADPCSDVRCAEGERCELDDVRHPVCRCSDDVTRCADVPYAPVCASDWTTYPNDCVVDILRRHVVDEEVSTGHAGTWQTSTVCNSVVLTSCHNPEPWLKKTFIGYGGLSGTW